MSNLHENPKVATTPSPPKSGKQTAGLIVMGIITAHLTLALLLSGKDYLYTVWPREIYNRIYEKPWVSLNVRNMGFQNPSEFKAAMAQLVVETKTGPEKNTPLPHFLLAELYNNLGQPAQAIKQYQVVIRQGQKDNLSAIRYQQFVNNAHAALAILYYEQDKAALAQQELAQVPQAAENQESALLIALKDSLEAPERGDFHLLLGQAFRSELKLAMATREIQKAEQLSESPQLKQEAANFLKTKMPQGVSELSPLARYYGLAARSAQTVDENLPKAAGLFEKSLKENPTFDWSYNELAIIYRQQKNYPKATAYAQTAISQNADFYNPYLTLGDIALDQENYSGAIQHFQTAKAILQRRPLAGQDSIVANIENQIAYAYESLNNNREAARYYHNALNSAYEAGNESDADYHYAQDGLARIAQSQQAQQPDTTHQISWKK